MVGEASGTLWKVHTKDDVQNEYVKWETRLVFSLSNNVAVKENNFTV